MGVGTVIQFHSLKVIMYFQYITSVQLPWSQHWPSFSTQSLWKPLPPTSPQKWEHFKFRWGMRGHGILPRLTGALKASKSRSNFSENWSWQRPFTSAKGIHSGSQVGSTLLWLEASLYTASFLMKLRTTCWDRSGLGPLPSVNSQDSPPQTCLQTSLIWTVAQLRVSWL